MGGGEDGQLPTHYVLRRGPSCFRCRRQRLCRPSFRTGKRYDLQPLADRCAESAGRRGAGRAARPEANAWKTWSRATASSRRWRLLNQTLRAATVLPAEAWHQRIADGRHGTAPAEAFFAAACVSQVYARSGGHDQSLQPGGRRLSRPAEPEVIEAAARAGKDALMTGPDLAAWKGLKKGLAGTAGRRCRQTRQRHPAPDRGLRPAAWSGRGQMQITAWKRHAGRPCRRTPRRSSPTGSRSSATPGRDIDVGMFRHWKSTRAIGPSPPCGDAQSAQGLVITSATSHRRSGRHAAEKKGTGRAQSPRAPNRTNPADRKPVGRCRLDGRGAADRRTPFGEPRRSRASAWPRPSTTKSTDPGAHVISDVRKRDDLNQVAAAYRELFLASGGGGALGLFTAISRLRAVRQAAGPGTLCRRRPVCIFTPSTSTAMDISAPWWTFSATRWIPACLGTDAVRDGVDVPGRRTYA